MEIRVKQGVTNWFEFAIEPFPYTRLVKNSRWTSGPDSQEQKYIQWKEDFRNLYGALDYNGYEFIPYHEPLSIGALFRVSTNWAGKDVDNLVKAVSDCLNPSRRKDYSDLATFAWVDDKQIKCINQVKSYQGDGLIQFGITPMWGRIDPMINFVEGHANWDADGLCSLQTYICESTLSYTWQLQLQAGDRQVLNENWDPTCSDLYTFYVWPQLYKDRYQAFLRPESIILLRLIQSIPRMTFETGLKVLQNRWGQVQEGWETGNGALWKSDGLSQVKAQAVLDAVRSVTKDPVSYFQVLQSNFNQVMFNKTAEDISQQFSIPWGSVRVTLRDMNLDWKSKKSPDIILNLFEERANKREQVKSKA